jgi:hypothetical protein
MQPILIGIRLTEVVGQLPDSFYRTLTALPATRALQSGQYWAIRPARSDWFYPGRVHEIPRKGKDFRPGFRAPSTDSPDTRGVRILGTCRSACKAVGRLGC